MTEGREIEMTEGRERGVGRGRTKQRVGVNVEERRTKIERIRGTCRRRLLTLRRVVQPSKENVGDLGLSEARQ